MDKVSRMGVGEIRKIALVVLIALVLATPGLAGIRGTEWGMSKTQIKKLEGKLEAEEEDRLVYLDRVGGARTEVIYLFNHRKELYSIEYHFHLDRSFMTTALDQFDRIGKILHDNYGPPDCGDRYSDREKKLGMLALEKPLSESWEKDRAAYISHTLRKDNVYKHVLIYSHRALTDEYEAFLRQKGKEKF